MEHRDRWRSRGKAAEPGTRGGAAAAAAPDCLPTPQTPGRSSQILLHPFLPSSSPSSVRYNLTIFLPWSSLLLCLQFQTLASIFLFFFHFVSLILSCYLVLGYVQYVATDHTAPSPSVATDKHSFKIPVIITSLPLLLLFFSTFLSLSPSCHPPPPKSAHLSHSQDESRSPLPHPLHPVFSNVL